MFRRKINIILCAFAIVVTILFGIKHTDPIFFVFSALFVLGLTHNALILKSGYKRRKRSRELKQLISNERVVD